MSADAAMIAAALAPSVIGMLTPRPSMPSGTASMPAMPDRSKYLNSILSTGFNPNDEIYRLAADQMSQQVNRQMALLGLGGSSLALGNMSAAQSELANKFVAEELERKAKALQMVLGYDMNVAQLQSGVNQFNANASWNNYNAQNAQNQQFIQGLGTLASTGVGMYQNRQAANNLATERAADRAMMREIYGLPPVQTGVPGSQKPGIYGGV